VAKLRRFQGWSRTHKLALAALVASVAGVISASIVPFLMASGGGNSSHIGTNNGQVNIGVGTVINGVPTASRGGPDPDRPSAAVPTMPDTSLTQGPPSDQTRGTSVEYLIRLRMYSSTGMPQSGTRSMHYESFPHSIGYRAISRNEVAVWELNGAYDSFNATVGLNEETQPIDQYKKVDFKVIANPDGGPMETLEDIKVSSNDDPASINVSVRRATRLMLETSPVSADLVNSDSIAVWGDPLLIPLS